MAAFFRNPVVVVASVFGSAYGTYKIIDMTSAGMSYDLDVDLTGKTYIVTGATSGIGKAAAEKLAEKNARVIMACRNRDKCLEMRRNIVLSTRNKQVYCRKVDLSDFDSIHEFVKNLYGTASKLEVKQVDGLINNAAVMKPRREFNKNGIEATLATNHMGSFLLTGLLLDKFLKQEAPTRIVFVNTNIASRDKLKLDLENLNDSDHDKKFDGVNVYKLSKLAQLMFAKELSEKLKDTNVSVLVADPGRTRTNLTSEMIFQKWFLSRWVLKVVGFFMGERKPVKAVKPIICAVADNADNVKNGAFLNREREDQAWGPNAENAALRRELWMMSEQWTGISSYLDQLSNRVALDLLANKEGCQTGKRSWKNLWLGLW